MAAGGVISGSGLAMAKIIGEGAIFSRKAGVNNEHSNLIGLSKYARICEWIMSRPQIQEEAVTMLANELQARVKPDGLAVVMEADHFCMHWRGVKDDAAMMTNSVMHGAFLKDANLRREFLSLLGGKH